MADENIEVMQWANVSERIDDCEWLETLLRNGRLNDLRTLRSTEGNVKTLLHFAVERGSTTSVTTLLAGEGDYNLRDLLEESDNSGRTPLQAAVQGDGQDVVARVTILLSAGADPLCSDHRAKAAVQLALEKGQLEVVRLLVNKIRDGAQREMLNDISFDLLQTALTISPKTSEEEKEDDAVKNLNILFAMNAIPNINQTNPRIKGSNRTALSTAFDLNYQRVLVWLLKRGACVNFDHEGKVLDMLTTDKMADLLDNSITLENSGPNPKKSFPDSRNCRLNLDYSFLMPSSKTPSQNESKPLIFMCRQRPSEAIHHPLLAALMAAKWSKLSYRYNSYRCIKSFLSFLFSFLLTTYTSNQLGSSANDTWGQTTLKCFILIVYMSSAILALLQLIVTCMLVRPLQLRGCKHPAIGIVPEIVLVLLVLLLICLWNVLPVNVTKHLAAWIVMASWFHFVITIGRSLACMKIFVSMLLIISLQLLKIVFLCAFLFVAFSGSFSLLLRPDQDIKNATSLTDFSSPLLAFPRVVAMATGEFGYDELRDGLLAQERAWASVSGVLLFLVFVFLVFLVIMNVMTGVAMVEAQELKRMDSLDTLLRQLQVAYLLEEFLVTVGNSELRIARCTEALGIRIKKWCEKRLSEIQLFNNSERQLEFWINGPSDRKISYNDARNQVPPPAERKYCALDEEIAIALRTDLLQHLEEKEKRLKKENSLRRLVGE